VTYEGRRDLVARRKEIGEEWEKLHPEGVTAENLKEFKAYMKRTEKEILKEIKQ